MSDEIKDFETVTPTLTFDPFLQILQCLKPCWPRKA